MLSRITRLIQAWRRPTWIVWLILSAALFLAGSATFALGGSHQMAQVGVLGAIAAVAVIAAFSG